MTAPEARMAPSISGTPAPAPAPAAAQQQQQQQQQPVELELKVRDYECDMDHVVNNAVYLNYLEHARHELLQARGLKFGELSKRGISLVVTRIEVDYKGSLVSGDAFIVRTTLQRSGRIRFHFKQSIHRVADNRLMLNAVVIGTALNAQGRPELPAELDKAFD